MATTFSWAAPAKRACARWPVATSARFNLLRGASAPKSLRRGRISVEAPAKAVDLRNWRRFMEGDGADVFMRGVCRRGVGSSSRELTVKHQTPNTKHQKNTKPQIPTPPRPRFGASCLELFWSLVFGVWCFPLLSVLSVISCSTCSSRGFPLFAQEFGGSDEGFAAFAFEAALEGNKILVADELEALETVHVVVAGIFAGHLAGFAAGHVDVPKVAAAGNEGRHVAGFLPGHVPEIAHQADAGMVDVAADGGAVGHLAQEMKFLAVERFEQEVEAGLVRVLAQFGQGLDQEFAGFPMTEFGLVRTRRHHDHSSGAQSAGGGQHFLKAIHGGAAVFLLVRNQAALHAATDDAEFDFAAFQRLLEFVGDFRQIPAMRLEGFETVGFEEIELFGNGLAGRDIVLARQTQARFRRGIGQRQRAGGGWSGTDDSSQRGESDKLAAIEVHDFACVRLWGQGGKRDSGKSDSVTSQDRHGTEVAQRGAPAASRHREAATAQKAPR